MILALASMPTGIHTGAFPLHRHVPIPGAGDQPTFMLKVHASRAECLSTFILESSHAQCSLREINAYQLFICLCLMLTSILFFQYININVQQRTHPFCFQGSRCAFNLKSIIDNVEYFPDFRNISGMKYE